MKRIILALLLVFTLPSQAGFFGGGGGGSFLLNEASCASRDLSTGAGQTEVLNVSEDGILHGISLEVTTNVVGSSSVDIDLTVGGTKRDLNVYTAANTFDSWIQNAGASGVPSYAIVAPYTSGDGSTANDGFAINLQAGYESSLLIEIDQAGAFTGGVIRVCALRSSKL